MKVTVYDAMMGSGKTTRIIKQINEAPIDQNFIVITPLLSECHRIAGTRWEEEDDLKRPICTEKNATEVMYDYDEENPLSNRLFKHPYFSKHGGKAESLPFLLKNKNNIVSTHQLFVNLTPSVLEDAKDYILVIDEMLSVYEVYTDVTKEEVDAMFELKWLYKDEDGVTLRFDRSKYGDSRGSDIDATKDTYYETFATLCDLGQLLIVDGKVIVWELPIDTLKVFKEVWIATYLFEDNIMSAYLKSHGIEYELVRFGKKPSEIKHLINIYSSTRKGNINSIGSKETSLSSSEFKNKKKDLCEQLNANLDNFIRNIAKAKKNDVIWTSFKHCKTSIQTRRNKDSWIPLNTKATNDYGDRHAIAYLINLYPNPMLVKASTLKGFSISNKVYALSEMVQFLWRSAIRNGEPIDVYVPSMRMRKLLLEWLNDEYE